MYHVTCNLHQQEESSFPRKAASKYGHLPCLIDLTLIPFEMIMENGCRCICGTRLGP